MLTHEINALIWQVCSKKINDIIASIELEIYLFY